MELSIDGILTVITIIYKNYDSYTNNSDQLNILLQKVKLFEMPLLKLKNNIELDNSIEMHIDNLNLLMIEIKDYLDDFARKSRIKRFFGALFIDERIRDFDTRIDSIKKDLNFEFDLNNHLIFHNFNSRTKEFNVQIENLINEMKTHKNNTIYMQIMSELINDQIEVRMHDFIVSFEYKLNEIQKSVAQQSQIQQDLVYKNLLEKLKNSNASIDMVENNDKIEEQLVKKDNALSDGNIKNVSTPLDIVNGYLKIHKNNIVLIKHFELLMQILILENTKGHFIYDGETIYKKTQYNSDTELVIMQIKLDKIKLSKKKYVINVFKNTLDKFLFKHGFVYLLDKNNFNTMDVIFEIKQFYNSSV